MQPLDPSLFGGSSSVHTTPQPTPDTLATDVLSKGTNVWYLHRSGVWQPARVTAVDETDPAGAFYQVRLQFVTTCAGNSCTSVSLPTCIQ